MVALAVRAHIAPYRRTAHHAAQHCHSTLATAGMATGLWGLGLHVGPVSPGGGVQPSMGASRRAEGVPRSRACHRGGGGDRAGHAVRGWGRARARERTKIYFLSGSCMLAKRCQVTAIPPVDMHLLTSFDPFGANGGAAQLTPTPPQEQQPGMPSPLEALEDELRPVQLDAYAHQFLKVCVRAKMSHHIQADRGTFDQCCSPVVACCVQAGHCNLESLLGLRHIRLWELARELGLTPTDAEKLVGYIASLEKARMAMKPAVFMMQNDKPARSAPASSATGERLRQKHEAKEVRSQIAKLGSQLRAAEGSESQAAKAAAKVEEEARSAVAAEEAAAALLAEEAAAKAADDETAARKRVVKAQRRAAKQGAKQQAAAQQPPSPKASAHGRESPSAPSPPSPPTPRTASAVEAHAEAPTAECTQQDAKVSPVDSASASAPETGVGTHVVAEGSDDVGENHKTSTAKQRRRRKGSKNKSLPEEPAAAERRDSDSSSDTATTGDRTPTSLRVSGAIAASGAGDSLTLKPPAPLLTLPPLSLPPNSFAEFARMASPDAIREAMASFQNASAMLKLVPANGPPPPAAPSKALKGAPNGVKAGSGARRRA